MKKILITGGTGTLGKAIVEHIHSKIKNPFEIHILSRDENKQIELKKKYPDLHMHVGDVTKRSDISSLRRHKFFSVFHCAAFKHVDISEHNVIKCVETNYKGVVNVHEILCHGRDNQFIFFTTDKAVRPINAYGHSKALAERYLAQPDNSEDNVLTFRWGNIIGSTGSVIPMFLRDIYKHNEASLTHHEMTRFWLTKKDAIDFIFKTLEETSGINTEVHIPWQKMKAATIRNIAYACADVLSEIFEKKEQWPVNLKLTGIRSGEKLHEDMDVYSTSDKSIQYSDVDLVKMIMPIAREMKWD